MSSEMILVSNNKTQIQLRPNIMPCKIAHSGPINCEGRYWQVADEKDIKTTYFRGRKLQGREAALSTGYQGVILQKTDHKIIETPTHQHDPLYDDLEQEDDMGDVPAMPKELSVTETIGTFDHMTVWAHEVVPDPADNAYLKGVEEWISFAQALHGDIAAS